MTQEEMQQQFDELASQLDSMAATSAVEEALEEAINEYDSIQEVAVESTESEVLEEPLVIEEIIPVNSGSTVMTESTSRFSGALWYDKIQEKVIILAGLGGIGSYVNFLLARMRPKSLFIYDDDIVEEANMSGQLYGTDNIGTSKASSSAEIAKTFGNYHNVFAVAEKFTPETEATDIMICGFDSMEARQIFFKSWYNHVSAKPAEKRKHCLFIDGRIKC